MYMVLTISGLRPHVALAARAKPLKILVAFYKPWHMRNERQHFVYGQTEGVFRQPSNPLAIHVHHWVVIFQLLVSTIEFVFDGANLSLFLTPQQCTRAKRGWPPPRSEADCPENMRTHHPRTPCAEFPSSRVGIQDQVPKVGPAIEPNNPLKHPLQPRGDYLPVPKVASDQAMEVHQAIKGVLRPACCGHTASHGVPIFERRPASHCFAQHGSRPMGRLGESIPAQGTYWPSLGTIPDPGKWQPGICRGEPINARAFREWNALEQTNLSPGKGGSTGQIPEASGG
ncbi:hypothetical protein EVAR_59910_1 [Eumeta japonica]|uniref:Uncharacterized protein n=1 Tax=Eumeta variegata TaxID=151549 RepID=A0A4C2AHH2_EUMVA|nr:hypothetical protein EVAR_59910_1 [Eumeta japonica]